MKLHVQCINDKVCSTPKMTGGRVAKRRRNLEHILLLDSTDQQQQQQQLVRVTDDVHSKDAIDHIQHKECATINDSYASRGPRQGW